MTDCFASVFFCLRVWHTVQSAAASVFGQLGHVFFAISRYACRRADTEKWCVPLCRRHCILLGRRNSFHTAVFLDDDGVGATYSPVELLTDLSKGEDIFIMANWTSIKWTLIESIADDEINQIGEHRWPEWRGAQFDDRRYSEIRLCLRIRVRFVAWPIGMYRFWLFLISRNRLLWIYWHWLHPIFHSTPK